MIAAVASGVLSLAACHKAAAPPPGPVVEHEHHAPHGGTLVEIGEEFAHLEVMFDANKGQLTFYALDGEAEEPVKLKQATLVIHIDTPASLSKAPVELKAVASVLTGETAEESSQFEVTRPELVGAAKVTGVVPALSIRGQDFHDLAFTVAPHSPSSTSYSLAGDGHSLGSVPALALLALQ